MQKILNKLKIFANVATGRHLFDIYPSQVAVEVTNHCNLACTICPHRSMTRPKGLMPLESFRRCVDRVKRHADFIYLYGIGESLIHPQLDEMIDYAHAAGLYTYLSTNAMLMDAPWSRRLLGSKLQSLTFAFDGHTQEQYERIRVKGRFETVIQNIRTFLQLKRQMGSKMHVVIQIVLTDPADEDAGDFRRLFSPAELAEVSQIRVKPFYDSFPAPSTEGSGPRRRCFFPWNFMFVYQDGRVGLCCVDYDGREILGDLTTQSVREIWNSPAIESIRRSLHRRDYAALPLCRPCTLPDVSGLRTSMLLASAMIPTGAARKLLPLYERVFLHKKRTKRTRRGASRKIA
ncbi:MAG: radical SAM/SPASM domain-containing protein [Alphaproteobacteria bacterium]